MMLNAGMISCCGANDRHWSSSITTAPDLLREMKALCQERHQKAGDKARKDFKKCYDANDCTT
jgi:hypothetical protein